MAFVIPVSSLLASRFFSADLVREIRDYTLNRDRDTAGWATVQLVGRQIILGNKIVQSKWSKTGYVAMNGLRKWNRLRITAFQVLPA
jgi:hypothetical protein